MSETTEEKIKRLEKNKEYQEFQKEVLEGKAKLPQGSTEISVQVDKDTIKKMVKEEMGNEPQEAQELLEDLKLKASLLYEKKFGEFIEPSTLSLDEAKRILKMASKVEEHAPSGIAPLNRNQLISSRLEGSQQENNPFGKSYDSYKDMIDDLRRMEKSKDKETSEKAKQVLNELFLRHRKLGKEQSFSSEKEGLKMPSIEELTKKRKKED